MASKYQGSFKIQENVNEKLIKISEVGERKVTGLSHPVDWLPDS